MDSYDKFERVILKIEKNLTYVLKKIMSPNYILIKICFIIIIFANLFWEFENWQNDGIFPLNFILHLVPTIYDEDALELKRLLMLNLNKYVYYKNFRIYNQNSPVYLHNDGRYYKWVYIDVKKCQHGYYKVTYDNGKALCVITKYSNIYYAPWGAEIVK